MMDGYDEIEKAYEDAIAEEERKLGVERASLLREKRAVLRKGWTHAKRGDDDVEAGLFCVYIRYKNREYGKHWKFISAWKDEEAAISVSRTIRENMNRSSEVFIKE